MNNDGYVEHGSFPDTDKNSEMPDMMKGNSMSSGRKDGAKSRGISADMLSAIRELSFVKTELEEYLDTHPNCKTAIDYYHQTVDALNKLTMEYQTTGNLIVAQGSMNKDRWEWVEGLWPWQNGKQMREGK